MAGTSQKVKIESGNCRLTSSIVRLFPNQALLNVLSELLINADTEYYQGELVTRTGDTLMQVQRALNRIVDAGFVTKYRRGKHVYYQAARQHPAFGDLRQVLIKTTGLCEPLRDALGQFRDKIEISFVFGSVASGSETADSDVDILIIGDVSSRRISSVLRPLGRNLGRELNTVIFKHGEFRKKLNTRNRFVTELVKSPKIWLIGSKDDLKKVGK